MGFELDIRCNTTGEVRIVHMEFAWNEGTEWWLTEGNFGCDCNRHDLFHAAELEGDCGTGKYTILRALLPDGVVVELEQV